MRINKYIAHATGISRRAADDVVASGRVTINSVEAQSGDQVRDGDTVYLDGRAITPAVKTTTLMLHKPAGYVVSRNGQGSKTIYDLLPTTYHTLKPVGRLDKDSSGLLLITNDGNLAHELTHPSHQKQKRYEVALDRPLSPEDKAKIEHGVQLEDGVSSLQITVDSGQPHNVSTRLIVTMHEGRNRQIRRTFAALGYTVTMLHRTQFGGYQLGTLPSGKYAILADQ